MGRKNRKAKQQPIIIDADVVETKINFNQEADMSNANQTNANLNKETEMDEIQKLIEQQREIQKSKDWKLSEIDKLKKELNKELEIIDNACRAAVKNINDEITRKQLELAFESKKLEVKSRFEPQIKALKIDIEAVAEAGSQIVGEKVGEFIAPVTKAGVGFFGSLAKRAGLTKEK